MQDKFQILSNMIKSYVMFHVQGMELLEKINLLSKISQINMLLSIIFKFKSLHNLQI